MPDRPKFESRSPVSQLSPTAYGILDAARRLLVRDGFAALSLEKIAAEAGVPKSLIRYHFGNKAGLIEALVDALIHDANLGLKDELDEIDAGHARVAHLLAAQRAMSADRRAFRVFYDVLPNALRDRKLRDRVAGLYEWYRSLDAWALRDAVPPLDEARLEPLAALSIAVLDGLAIQLMLAPRSFDHAGAYALWEAMLGRFVADVGPAHAVAAAGATRRDAAAADTQDGVPAAGPQPTPASLTFD
jgi:AcrR family transcriptional regulator